MSSTLPSQYEVCVSREEIHEAILKLAPRISDWVGEDAVLAICVLRGGVFFFADIVREIPQSLQLEFLQIRTYDSSQNKKELKNISIDIPFPVQDKKVLVIDDICESGGLLRDLTASLAAAGASEIKTAVMIHRDLPQQTFHPDFIAVNVTYEDWLVGLGLDDREEWRNIPHVCKIIR